MMLNAIKSFFEENISSGTPEDPDHQLRLATAALLIEMMQQDHKVIEEEREAVRAALREQFNLDEDEIRELLELARQEAEMATDYYQFTRLIASQCSPEEKKKVIEYLWKIAYSDNHLDPLEEHMIRRLADLLYVPHRDFIHAKHKAQRDLN